MNPAGHTAVDVAGEELPPFKFGYAPLHCMHWRTPPSGSPQFSPVSFQPSLHFHVAPPSGVSLGLYKQSYDVSSSILPYVSIAGSSSSAFKPSTTPKSYASSMAAEQLHVS
ncbi:hypothetical protein MT325_m799L [Paramecium bursaria chlorella virus MT325]|uniref:Uncharacterized protein m799L n=1 Tax=Paramecium bursaria Chlorella virus MT325 TaxID=346932 RepID=A7IVH9_PBCVM|nr:hypothetical protein MT325_m799L [Paramecium bursaria chlorella virus MT325]